MGDPTSYHKSSPDGQFVFVMLVPLQFEQRLDPTTDQAAKSREIRSKWPKSGMYKNDGSRDPLWTVEGYYYSAWPASDGVHVVLWNPAWNPDTAVLTFVADGQVLHTYRGDDLIGPRGRMTGAGHNWGFMKSQTLDEESMTFRVETDDREVLWFDVQTGERITRVSQFPRWFVGLAAVGVTLLTIVGIRQVRRCRRRSASR